MNLNSLRLELAIPAVIAVVMAGSATLAAHRASIKEEFMARCEVSATRDACQAQWWKSGIRQNWSSPDMWACWVGNPEACAEAEAANRRPDARAADPAKN